MSLHLSAIRLLIATLPPSKIQAGLISSTSIELDLILMTLPNTGAVPMFSRSASPDWIGLTLISSVMPTAESNRFTSNFKILEFSGSVPGLPITEPIKESLLVMEGSNFVPMATKPPGFTDSTMPAAVPREVISVSNGSYDFFSH